MNASSLSGPGNVHAGASTASAALRPPSGSVAGPRPPSGSVAARASALVSFGAHCAGSLGRRRCQGLGAARSRTSGEGGRSSATVD